MLKKLPKAFRNFYVVALAVFFVWMLALDSNNLIARYQLGAQLSALENAREKYLMKKESEDIFVIEEK
jgi:cell division protein DivIC